MPYLWCIVPLFAVSIILIIVGISILPPTGGVVPQGQSVEDYQKEQQRLIVASNGFVITMIGSVLCCLVIIGFIIKNYYEEPPETIIPHSPQPIQIIVKESPKVESLKSGNLPHFNTQTKLIPLKSILKKPEYTYPPPYNSVKIIPYTRH
jgi:hypothetical protein